MVQCLNPATTRTDKDVNGKKEPHVEFKNGKSTSANGMDESEGTMTQLSPTLFDISLTLKKVRSIGHPMSSVPLERVNDCTHFDEALLTLLLIPKVWSYL